MSTVEPIHRMDELKCAHQIVCTGPIWCEYFMLSTSGKPQVLRTHQIQPCTLRAVCTWAAKCAVHMCLIWPRVLNAGLVQHIPHVVCRPILRPLNSIAGQMIGIHELDL